MLTHVYQCFIGKEFRYNENGTFQYILSTPIRKNRLLGKSGFIRWEGVFHNVVILPVAREAGSLLPENFKIN